MSDTEHKWVITANKVVHRPALYPVSGQRPLTRAPVAAVLRAQDSVLGRPKVVVAQQHRSGSDEWKIPGTAPAGGTTQSYPTQDTWQQVSIFRCRLPPGCALEAHVVYSPSGLTEVLNSPNWELAGAVGQWRAQITFDNGTDSETVTVGLDLPGSKEANAAVPGGEGEGWNVLQHRKIEDIIPEAALNSAKEMQKWSEWPLVTIAIDQAGGARILHALVFTRPFAHAQDHDEAADVSAHAYSEGGATPDQLPTPYPQTEAADGGTFEEQRFGSQRLVEVAGEQGEKMGPRILVGSAHAELEANVLDTDGEPLNVTSATPVSIYDGSTAYSEGMPGYVVGASYAQLRHISGEIALRGRAAVIPVRVWVYAALAGGASKAYLRVQASAWSWVDVPITSSTAQSWTWTGYLEAQAIPDPDLDSDGVLASCAPLAYVVGGGSVDVYDWAVSFGHQ